MELLKKRYLCECGRWFFDRGGPARCAKNRHEAGNYLVEPHPVSKHTTPRQSYVPIALAAPAIVAKLASQRAAEKRPRKS
jgi:hypothetical protein